jgi:prophage antirepressor-like protein
MNELTVIQNVRGYMKDDTAYLNLEDVARGLGFTTVATSGNECVRWARVEEYLNSFGYTISEPCQSAYIPENIFYRLAMKAKNETAEKFQALVADEILPSIRKTGSYSIQRQIPKTFAEALRLAADLEEQRQMLLPKADQFDKFISGENYQDMNTAAKALSWGRNKLFAELRNRKILMSGNRPYQSYIDRGYFVVKEKPIDMGGTVFNKPQTYVTAKGLSWLERVLSD